MNFEILKKRAKGVIHILAVDTTMETGKMTFLQALVVSSDILAVASFLTSLMSMSRYFSKNVVGMMVELIEVNGV